MSIFKASVKRWDEDFDLCLLSNGFRMNNSDKCIYCNSIDGAHIRSCLYIDNLLMFGTSLDIINNAKLLLKRNFDMK